VGLITARSRLPFAQRNDAREWLASLMTSFRSVPLRAGERRNAEERRLAVKRNSWFVVKMQDSVELEQTRWSSSLGRKWEHSFRRAAKVALAAGQDPEAFAATMKTNIVMSEKRMYWREDWEKVDDLEGDSVWTPYRREALKFQKRTDAEVFAFERTKLFPPYIGLVHVERLRWNPNPKGPISYPGPQVRMALAT